MGNQRERAKSKRTAATGETGARRRATGKAKAGAAQAPKRKSTPRVVSKATREPKRKATTRPKATRSRETQDERRQRAIRILSGLKQAYADANCALHHRSALELLVATILSAQCTDERVNQVTPELFRRYPDAAALASAKQDELEGLIRSTGFFRNKAKSLIGLGQKLVENYDGEVPDAMADLLTLPGVARKTANCVLGTWFGKNDGIVVDTHVGRLALRLRLLTSARDDKDAVKIESDLMNLFPEQSWTYLAHALIQHGRQVCQARKPQCTACPLSADCPSVGTFG